MHSRTSKAKCLWKTSWTRFSRGSLPGKEAIGFEPRGRRQANVTFQSGEGRRDAVRCSDYELQGSEDDCACKRDRRTRLRRVILSLCWRTEALVEEGFRPQETEETAPRCTVAMPLRGLRVVQQPCYVLVCFASRPLSILPQSWLRYPLSKVCQLHVHPERWLYVVPKVRKEVSVDGRGDLPHMYNPNCWAFATLHAHVMQRYNKEQF